MKENIPLNRIKNRVLSEKNLSESLKQIIKAILYFEIFHFPLTKREIFHFTSLSSNEFEDGMKFLLERNVVKKIGDFFVIDLNENHVNKRLTASQKAKKKIKWAKRIGKFIYQFPFVQSVFISGSLAKGSYEEGDDFDYFIITKPGHLWKARFFLTIFKKIFLLNSKKYFCINYYMSADRLEIEEKNRFTATECITLIPVNGNKDFNRLLKQNVWVRNYYGNYNVASNNSKPSGEFFLKKWIEFSLRNAWGAKLEVSIRKWILNYQTRKYAGSIRKEEFDLAFKSGENVSKHHPQNFQIKTLNLLNERIKKFNQKYGMNIPLEKF